QLKEAEQRAADVQKLAATEKERGSGPNGKVGEAERMAEEAQQRATQAAERATQAERQARELSGAAAEAEKRAATSLQRALAAERKVADVEPRLKRTEDERDELIARLDQIEHATAKASATPPNGKSSKPGSRSSRAPVAQKASNADQRRSRSRTPG
ncbi:MAG TPA: hypothetical protein VFM40_01705, partial [Actinomycetota bacterium]|nr:hypothetical protein [Actinomycetota bacterium]